MGQFKPMVKMETTEPSVILKMKKGGHATLKGMKSGGKSEDGHKSMKKMMDGGVMDALASTPALVGRPALNSIVAAPRRPKMNERRMAMAPRKALRGAAPMGGVPPAMAGNMPMKKGGEADDMAQDKAMIKKAMKQHDSQEHKGGKGTKLALKKGGKSAGYKTGGVVKGQGGFATGGVVDGQGGFKNGGKSSKKAFATGGTVNSGKPVAMQEGRKPVPSPVSISKLAGTYKGGGKVAPNNKSLQRDNDAEFAPTMRSAKADSNLKYGSPKRMAGGGSVSDKESEMANRAFDNHYTTEKADNEADKKMMTDALMFLPRQAKKAFNSLTGQGAVTTTEREVSKTVSPPSEKRKNGGRA